ncbi:MAG: bifunctional nuclease family protein [Candidatus Diapherotrites archaeon]|nr:bifunctional nuclease family protein [Candidatus Diapherotrites archaeon]
MKQVNPKSSQNNSVQVHVGWNTTGFSRASASVENGKIILSSGCYHLALFADARQLDSISKGIRGEIGDRPFAHQLMSDSFEFFGVKVVMVKITKIENNIYYARIILRRNNDVLDIDSKPSDAIALAVRAGAPIYVSNSLLRTHGEKVC